MTPQLLHEYLNVLANHYWDIFWLLFAFALFNPIYKLFSVNYNNLIKKG